MPLPQSEQLNEMKEIIILYITDNKSKLESLFGSVKSNYLKEFLVPSFEQNASGIRFYRFTYSPLGYLISIWRENQFPADIYIYT